MPYLQPDPGLFGFKGTDDTGRESAEAQRGNDHRRKIVLDTLRGLPGGATPDEIARRLGWDVLSVRPRMSELRNMGLIAPTGRRRQTGRGGNAAVMVVMPEERP